MTDQITGTKPWYQPRAIWGSIPVLPLAVFMPSLALAAELSAAPGALDSLRGVAIEIGATVLFSLVSWILVTLRSKLKLSADSEVRRYLDNALYSATAYAQDKLLTSLDDLQDPKTREQMTQIASAYVQTRVPDALKRFGLDDADIRDLIRARLPLPSAVAAGQPRPA